MRYTLRYLEIKEKSFNKESTLNKFMQTKVYKTIHIRKGNELIRIEPRIEAVNNRGEV